MGGACQAEKRAAQAASAWREPTCPLAHGADCGADYSWHVDPASPSWSDVTIVLCDGSPACVEQHRGEWLSTVGSWCPWGGSVTSVDDRR